jgi:hypothetical protein
VGGDKEALTEACGSEEVADEILMLWQENGLKYMINRYK